MPTPTSSSIAIQRKGARRKVIEIVCLTLWIPASAAFTVVYESAFAVPTTRTCSSRIALFQSSPKKEDSDDLLSLLDDSILLYSLLNNNNNNNNSDPDDATDIGSLRKREIVTLIEQVALSLPTSTTNDDNSGDDDDNETSDIAEIGGKLDDTILRGYQSTFSNDEEDAWIQNVQNLSAEYEKRLQRIEDLTVVLKQIPPKKKKEEVTKAEQLSDRLDQMKTLIDPVGLIKTSLVVRKPSTTPNGDARSKTSSPQTLLPVEAKVYENKAPTASSSRDALIAPPNIDKALSNDEDATTVALPSSAESRVTTTTPVDGNAVSASLVENTELKAFASLTLQQSDVQDGENVSAGSGGVIVAFLAAAAVGAFLLAPPPDLSLQSATPEPIIVRSITPDPSPPSETSLWLLNTYK